MLSIAWSNDVPMIRRVPAHDDSELPKLGSLPPMTQTPAAGLDAASIRVHRKGSGPTLVLLHCLGVDHGLWDIAAAGLEDSLTLLSYDFPGHGETRVPDRGYSIQDLSGQLTAVLAREGVTRAHVAGISLGGLVAQHFAATNPALVDRLVLIDTTPRYVDEARQMWVERARAARTAGVPSLIDGLLKIWFTDGFVVITGEIGAGKTTLIETFLHELQADVMVAQINQTQLTPTAFLQTVLVQFGFSPFKMRKAELISTLNNFLIEQYAAGRRVLLIVDEAQNLTMRVLEENGRRRRETNVGIGSYFQMTNAFLSVLAGSGPSRGKWLSFGLSWFPCLYRSSPVSGP
jgi:pimeloyl-ACP methyl ester carboxylesterase